MEIDRPTRPMITVTRSDAVPFSIMIGMPNNRNKSFCYIPFVECITILVVSKSHFIFPSSNSNYYHLCRHNNKDVDHHRRHHDKIFLRTMFTTHVKPIMNRGGLYLYYKFLICINI